MRNSKTKSSLGRDHPFNPNEGGLKMTRGVGIGKRKGAGRCQKRGGESKGLLVGLKSRTGNEGSNMATIPKNHQSKTCPKHLGHTTAREKRGVIPN